MLDGNWFAIYTRPGSEKKFADFLTKKKVKNYLPLNKTLHQWDDRKKTKFESLFPCYVFVYLKDKKDFTMFSNGRNVNFVYWLGEPAIIKNDEIDAIEHFLKEFPYAKLEKVSVDLNGEVRIINDPKMVRKGNVLEVR